MVHPQFGSLPFSLVLKPNERHVAKIQSKGYKERMSNITFIFPRKSDPLSLSPQQAPHFFFAYLLLLHHHCHMSIKGTEIKACWRRQGKTRPILLDPHNAASFSTWNPTIGVGCKTCTLCTMVN